MKKIVLAFDGTHFCESALRFARQLNEKSPVLLTGAFLPQVDYANLWSFSGGSGSGRSYIPLVEDTDAKLINDNIKRFESFCRKNNIAFEVHKDYLNFTIPELKKETRFADLLILSSEVFYEQAGTESPNDYLKETLHGVECPVLLIPEKFEFPETNILAYNGSEGSVYAIKQFAYLFPELANNSTMLIYANKSGDDIPDEINIKSLTKRHFPQLMWVRLNTLSKKIIASWLTDIKNPILIAGAFGRSELSMVFKKSFVADMISDHRLPVFIAHK